MKLAKKLCPNSQDYVCAMAETEVPWVSQCKKYGGGHLDIAFNPENFKVVYRDEYTNEVLPED